MENKYNINFNSKALVRNITRLTNQIWKLIPMRENNENWQKQLDTVIIEITGLNEIFLYSPLFIQLLSKLEGLNIKQEISFYIYRKTVFEIIEIIQTLKGEIINE